MTYQVFEYDFTFLGTVVADTSEDALAVAKRKFRNAIALMVEPA